jgi:hypothetical protein
VPDGRRMDCGPASTPRPRRVALSSGYPWGRGAWSPGVVAAQAIASPVRPDRARTCAKPGIYLLPRRACHTFASAFTRIQAQRGGLVTEKGGAGGVLPVVPVA